MKFKLILSSLLLGLFCTHAEASHFSSDTLNIATYNLRVRVSFDKHEKSWKKRKSQVAKLIKNNQFDVFGVQELKDMKQQKDLTKRLNNYNFISFGRDSDNGEKGERLALFYNTQRFNLEQSGHFFLGENTEKAEKGWDAAYNRICVWAQLSDKNTGKSFFVFDVHLDHKGQVARRESAKLIVGKINELAKGKSVFCLGDFNANETDTVVYNTMTKTLKDSRKISKTAPQGSAGSFNDWATSADSVPSDELIDYIFVNHVNVDSYRIINDKFGKKTFPSDHFPVMIQASIQ